MKEIQHGGNIEVDQYGPVCSQSESSKSSTFSSGFGCFTGSFFTYTIPRSAIFRSFSHSRVFAVGRLRINVSASCAHGFNLSKSRATWRSEVGASVW